MTNLHLPLILLFILFYKNIKTTTWGKSVVRKSSPVLWYVRLNCKCLEICKYNSTIELNEFKSLQTKENVHFKRGFRTNRASCHFKTWKCQSHGDVSATTVTAVL